MGNQILSGVIGLIMVNPKKRLNTVMELKTVCINNGIKMVSRSLKEPIKMVFMTANGLSGMRMDNLWLRAIFWMVSLMEHGYIGILMVKKERKVTQSVAILVA